MSEFNSYDVDIVGKIENGQIIKGKVVSVRHDEVFVDTGYKAEGVITLAELAYPVPMNAHEAVCEGQVIDVFVLQSEDNEGNVLLSKVKADQQLAWDTLEKAHSQQEPVNVTVATAVKGGLAVAVSGIRGFIPASQIDLQYTADLQEYIGKTLTVIPIEVDAENEKVVLSRRKLLEIERDKAIQKLFASISAGQVIKGNVSRLADFGAFVDVGGIEGLIHISDLAWHRVNHASEIVNIGDEVEVAVLKVDPVAKRLSLSLKKVQRDPWYDALEEISEGMVLSGKVVKLAKFGAFVELKKGIEGLVHVSELSDKRISSAEEAVAVGQQLSVKVMNIDRQNKRISLSVTAVQQEREREEYQQYLEAVPKSTGVTLGDKFAHLFKRED